MKNRIASLFALDTLLGGTSNGHGPVTHLAEPSRKRKQKAARRGARGREVQRTGERTVDKGDPIRCQHDVAYKPVTPVDVGTPSSPSAPASLAQQLGDEYDVEAFEEPDEDLTLRLNDLENDEEPAEEFEMASGTPWEGEPPPAPEEDPEPATTVRAQSYRKPPTFAAEMTAVEQDLAELAARAVQPTPVAPTRDPSATGDSAADPAVEPAPVPPPKPSGHAVFDQMAQGMGFATEFRLPPVQLSQVFSALDRQLDAEAIKPASGVPVAGAPQSAGASA